MTCVVCRQYSSALYRDACARCNTSRLAAATRKPPWFYGDERSNTR